MPTSMEQLYTYNPGTSDVTPAAPAQASNASGYLSQAKEATAKTQQTDPTSLASNQLNDITKQDSPLMQRARQEGMLQAAKRGLQNSSISAGAAEGAMVDRATPLAQQNSATLNTQALANQTAENEAEQLNANLGTSTSQQNAALQTDVSKFNAGSATDVSKFNSETTARANEQNAAASNAMRQKVVEENAALNRQFLSGEQTMDLASIQGQYQQLISSNAAAAQLYDSYFQSISQTMSNKDIDPTRVAQTVQQQQQMLNSGLALIQNMGAMTFGAGNTAVPAGGGVAPPTAAPTGVAPPQAVPNVTTSQNAPNSLVRNVGGRYGIYQQ